MENRVDLCSREESDDPKDTQQDMRKSAFASYFLDKKNQHYCRRHGFGKLFEEAWQKGLEVCLCNRRHGGFQARLLHASFVDMRVAWAS